MNIVLIGMRGTGKAGTARHLCVLTGLPLMSVNKLIRYESDGSTLQRILRDHGLPFLKSKESTILRKLSEMGGLVITCGVQTLTELDDAGEEHYSPERVELLKKRGIVVWLRGDIERLALHAKGNRFSALLPSTEELTQQMVQQQHLFAEAADIIVSIENKSKKEVAREVLGKVVQRGFSH